MSDAPPDEQLPPSDFQPMDLRKSSLDYAELQRQLPRWEAMLEHIKKLYAEAYPDHPLPPRPPLSGGSDVN